MDFFLSFFLLSLILFFSPPSLLRYNWASEASPTLGCSIEISRDICIYVYMCVCRGPKSVGGITWAKRAHAQSQYLTVKSDQCHSYYSFRLYARAALAWTEEKRSHRRETFTQKRNVHLEMRNLKQTELHRLKNRGKKG